MTSTSNAIEAVEILKKALSAIIKAIVVIPLSSILQSVFKILSNSWALSSESSSFNKGVWTVTDQEFLEKVIWQDGTL